MPTAAKAIAYAHITKEPGIRGGRACIARCSTVDTQSEVLAARRAGAP